MFLIISINFHKPMSSKTYLVLPVFLRWLIYIYIYTHIHIYLVGRHFSRMRSKGSRFTLGSRVCSLDVAFTFATVRNRPQNRLQPFAAVRNRPRDCYMAVPMESSAEGSFLEVSNVSLLRFAWQAWHSLRDIQTCIVTCQKWFCVAGKILLRRCVAVFVAGAALWTCPSSFCVVGATL